jgi:hypothetical protein
MENDASTIDRLEHEKSQVLGSVGDLKARITSLEGQVNIPGVLIRYLTETIVHR